MAKLVDAPDLGSGVLRRVGSSPIRRTKEEIQNVDIQQNVFPFFIFQSTKRQKRRNQGNTNSVLQGFRQWQQTKNQF